MTFDTNAKILAAVVVIASTDVPDRILPELSVEHREARERYVVQLTGFGTVAQLREWPQAGALPAHEYRPFRVPLIDYIRAGDRDGRARPGRSDEPIG